MENVYFQCDRRDFGHPLAFSGFGIASCLGQRPSPHEERGAPLIHGVAEIDEGLVGVFETNEATTGIFDLKCGIDR